MIHHINIPDSAVGYRIITSTYRQEISLTFCDKKESQIGPKVTLFRMAPESSPSEHHGERHIVLPSINEWGGSIVWMANERLKALGVRNLGYIEDTGAVAYTKSQLESAKSKLPKNARVLKSESCAVLSLRVGATGVSGEAATISSRFASDLMDFSSYMGAEALSDVMARAAFSFDPQTETHSIVWHNVFVRLQK